MTKLRDVLLVATSMVALAAQDGWAQASAPNRPALSTADTGSDGAEEIVVTAQRREQNLQDVGIAVAAFSGDTLRKLGLSSSTDLTQLTPGVYNSGSLAGQSQQFTVRGVTQSDFNDAIEAPVAVYVDDVYVPTQQGQTLALFDVQRVEVLKGPQGTLFGRNATGGLVHTLVAQPDSSATSGYVNVGYARFNEMKLEGAVNVPVTDKMSVRASGYYNHIDNYWKNVYPAGVASGAPTNFGPPGAQPTPCCQDEGGGRTYAGRLQLKFEPTDKVTVRLVASGAGQRLSSAPYTSSATIGTFDTQGHLIQVDRVSPNETRLAIGPGGGNYTNFAVIPFASFGFPGNGTRVPGATWFGYTPINPQTLQLSSDFARSSLNRDDSWTGAAHIDYDAGDIKIASITAFQYYTKQFLMDADGSPSNLFLFGTKAKTDAFSQEVRLSGGSSRFRWVAGAFYLDIAAHSTQGLLGPKGSLLSGLFGLSAVGVDAVDTLKLDTNSFSGFGQIEYDFADKWTFILGGRAIREHQDYNFASLAALNQNDFQVDNSVALFPLQPSYSNSRTKILWAGKAQLEYRPISKLLLYAGVNRGVKGGSYNAPLPDGSPPLSAAQMSYGAETLYNYEGGFKYGDRHFSINGSGYYYDYRNYQAFLFASISGYVQNANAKTYGLDLDTAFQITDNLRAAIGGSYSHGSIKNFQIAPGVFRTVRPTYAPRAQISGNVTYEFPQEIAGGKVLLNAQGSYASGFYHNLRNFNADWFSGHTLFNFSAGWDQGEGGLRVTAYINNAFDKRYGVIGFDSAANCGCNIESFGKPRSYGISVERRF
ncbi:MAG: TonB-dependent receptor [Rhodospirillaceae bacterium]|nr:MAG: TonB-dependent receptor [Rhodospirillaceae bacterium]